MDEDGIEDIESIYIVKNDDELFWELRSDIWTKETINNEVWIGINGIALPESFPFKEGSYRLIVIDSIGERVETEFYLKPVQNKKTVFPDIANSRDGIIDIKSPYSENTVFIFSETGELINSHKTKDREYSFLTQQSASGSIPKTAYIYSYSDELGCGLFNGPFYLR